MRAEPRQDLGSAPGSETPTPLSEWHEGARDGSLSACETILSDIVERYAHYARMGDQVESARHFVEDQLVREFDAWIEANHRDRLGLPPA